MNNPTFDEVLDDNGNGGIEALRKYIDLGFDVNVLREDRVDSLLQSAIEHENPSAVKMLLENGADPNLCHADASSPLSKAIDLRGVVMQDDPENNSLEIIELLLKFGANPNIKDPENFDAFDVAEIYGYLPVLELLRRYSASK